MLLDKTRHAGTCLLKARPAVVTAGAILAAGMGARTPALLVLSAQQVPSRNVRVAVSLTDPTVRFVTGLERAHSTCSRTAWNRRSSAYQADPVSIGVVWACGFTLWDCRDSLRPFVWES